jgi:very-short-patch-repair endonuclease
MNYYSYNESKEYLKQFSIKSSYEFYIMIKQGSFDKRLNKRPYEYFNTKKRKCWISWEDFLSFSINERLENKYLDFKKAIEYVRGLNLKSQKEWNIWCKNNNLSELKIPSNPNIVYKDKGWVSLSDWLNNTSYKNLTNINYLSYKECKKYIKFNLPEIKNRKYWLNLDKSKLPIFIPKRPDHIYKKSGDWVNWETFLDSDISPRSKSKLFLAYEEAKKYVQLLKFKDQYEYYNYLNKNNIKFLPKRPGKVYSKNWKGYLEFLGCSSNKESIGERLIKEYLDDKGIFYQREKRFKTCVNIKELPFDFYLAKYNVCIEYDGELHYKPSPMFGGQDSFERFKVNDSIKTNWCKSNNIKLLRINYLKKQKINKILDDFFLSLLNL